MLDEVARLWELLGGWSYELATIPAHLLRSSTAAEQPPSDLQQRRTKMAVSRPTSLSALEQSSGLARVQDYLSRYSQATARPRVPDHRSHELKTGLGFVVRDFRFGAIAAEPM